MYLRFQDTSRALTPWSHTSGHMPLRHLPFGHILTLRVYGQKKTIIEVYDLVLNDGRKWPDTVFIYCSKLKMFILSQSSYCKLYSLIDL